jgi:oligosaccharide repeat unit polymerase
MAAFYIVYCLLAGLGTVFIRYKSLSFRTIVVIFIFIAASYFGFRLGESSPLRFAPREKPLNLKLALSIGTTVASISVLIAWGFILRHYGSLGYVFANAFSIRISTIGSKESAYPLVFGYGASICYGFFPLALILKRKVEGVCLFIVILLLDLVSFGRVGVIFATFILLSWALVQKVRLLSIKNIMAMIILLAVLIMPRLIRGNFDNFEGTISGYRPYFRYELPSSTNMIASNYIYYFSSGYALNEYLMDSRGSDKLGLGSRIFAPIANMTSRLFGGARPNLIDKTAEIPFEYNIYTAIHDWLIDFGVLGMVIGPLLLNFLLAILSKGEGAAATAVKIYSMAYILFTPVYFIFTFGGFFLSLFLLLCIRIQDVRIA